MSTLKKGRKISDTSEISDNTDALDGGINYQNLQNSSGSEKDLEFTNPAFKYKPPLFNSTRDNLGETNHNKPKTNEGFQREEEEAYDKLGGIPLKDLNTKNNIKDTENKPKMGVSNYGYMDEKPRPDSWDSSLSAFSPYAVDTPIRGGVPIPERPPSVGYEMNESPPRERVNTSTKSDYSSITDINPYMMAPDNKDPQYEDLAGLRASANKKRPSQNSALPAVPTSQKKANMLYEPAVIASGGKTAIAKRTSIQSESYDDQSNYCHFVFTILVAILAILALVLAFLLIFGTISAKKCKECEVTTSTNNDGNTGGNTGGQTGGGGQTSTDELEKRFALLQGNLTELRNSMSSSNNASEVISTLQNELNAQKALVTSLTKQLDEQKQATATLNSQLGKEKNKTKQNFLDINNRIIQHETSSGLQFKYLTKSIETTKTVMENSINSHRMEVSLLLDSKVSKTNFTQYKEDVSALLKNQSQTITKAIFWHSRLISAQNSLKKNEKDTSQDVDVKNQITRVANRFTDFKARTEHNITNFSNKIANISVIEGPRGPPGFNGTSLPPKMNCSTVVSGKFTGKSSVDAYCDSSVDMSKLTGASCQGNAEHTMLQKTRDGQVYCTCYDSTHGRNIECYMTCSSCSLSSPPLLSRSSSS